MKKLFYLTRYYKSKMPVYPLNEEERWIDCTKGEKMYVVAESIKEVIKRYPDWDNYSTMKDDVTVEVL